MTQSGPISSCARAATAEEVAFRIDHPLAAARDTRVVALDAAAEEIVRRTSRLRWEQARFYSAVDPGHCLVTMSGATVPLAGELETSDSLVLVSTSGENAQAAATIGAACQVRGIMTAGLVVTPGWTGSRALSALRPHARILLVPADEDDLVELLRATRS